jgi:hypothetical protein
MHTSLHRLVSIGLVVVLALVTAFTPPAQALPTPSKTAADQTLTERAKDLAALDAVLDQKEVMAVLASHGFTRDEVNQRLAQLSPEELSALAAQTDQLQSAGQPTYVWVLIAVLIVVAIVAVAD